MIEHLERIPNVEVSHPMGSFYCIVKLPVEDAEDFSKYLLTDFKDNNQTIMLAPANGFYSTPGFGLNEVRIAFVLAVIFASIDAIEGRRNCSSNNECTGTTLMFEAAANPL